MKRPVWMLFLVAALALASTMLIIGCNEAKALNVNEVLADLERTYATSEEQANHGKDKTVQQQDDEITFF